MFNKEIYINRRKKLSQEISSGILFFPGNDESPMNYMANTFRFRQDSNFRYFFGLNLPGISGVIDLDKHTEILFANDFQIEDTIWVGPQPTMEHHAENIGIHMVKPTAALGEYLKTAMKDGRKIHFLPPYRGETFYLIEQLLGISYGNIPNNASLPLIEAVANMRLIKEPDEIAEMEKMVDVAYLMHTTVMKMAKPGVTEQKIAGTIEGIALSYGAGVSFPVILSQNGEILHNHSHGNVLQKGKLIVTDAGAESNSGYASDITRTIPVSGVFAPKQKDVYQIVLDTNLKAFEITRPGVFYKDVHLEASLTIATGLKSLGLMKGNMDDAVALGAHALFFVHGLGHQLGMDVHDLEGLGENNFGYDQYVKRSEQFGTAYLRFGRELHAGMVVTNEPGIYFIPELIALWKKENKFSEFINYDKVGEYLDFGGIRIEDNVLVTSTGNRLLGKPIPKSVSEIEEVMKG